MIAIINVGVGDVNLVNLAGISEKSQPESGLRGEPGLAISGIGLEIC